MNIRLFSEENLVVKHDLQIIDDALVLYTSINEYHVSTPFVDDDCIHSLKESMKSNKLYLLGIINRERGGLDILDDDVQDSKPFGIIF